MRSQRIIPLLLVVVLLISIESVAFHNTITGSKNPDHKANAYVVIETINNYEDYPYDDLNNLIYAYQFGSKIKEVFNAEGINTYHFYDDIALESDFEYTDDWPPFIRSYDTAIFSGHGEPLEFLFNTNLDSDHSIGADYKVEAVETYWYYRLKWIVICTCRVLADNSYVRQQWIQYAFRGGSNYNYGVELHGIYGFASNGYDYWSRGGLLGDNQANTGKTFAQLITYRHTIKDAWFNAIAQHEKPPWFTGFDPAIAASLNPVIIVWSNNGTTIQIYYGDEAFLGFGINYEDPNTLYEYYQNLEEVEYVNMGWIYEAY